MPVLYTIGHSNRSLADFIAILQAHGITQLVDVRTIPKSRRLPWFNGDQLQITLRQIHIRYQHIAELGGLRHARKDSINQAWQNASFRGFADYMQTPAFYTGLKHLNQLLNRRYKTAILCAEAVPWRCHRSMIADAEVVRGIKVFHILSETQIRPHILTEFAVVNRNKKPIKVFYPDKNQ